MTELQKKGLSFAHNSQFTNAISHPDWCMAAVGPLPADHPQSGQPEKM